MSEQPDSMVERVAGAIVEFRASAPEGELISMEKLARAAITAMREPTVEMSVAGTEDWMVRRASEDRSDAVWRAMIDAALAEGQP